MEGVPLSLQGSAAISAGFNMRLIRITAQSPALSRTFIRTRPLPVDIKPSPRLSGVEGDEENSEAENISWRGLARP